MGKRENWGTRMGFIFAAVGSAIGLGNIWRFPYLTYANGGGAFLIPYFVALLTAGIPIIILEMAIGHKYKSSPVVAFSRMSKHAEWMGWMQVFIAFIIGIYYAVIVAWALNFTLIATKLGWGTNTTSFFYNHFLHVSSGPLVLGGIVPNLAIFAIITWLLIWITLFSGIRKGIEFISKIFMPILFVGLIIILIRVVTLKGAGYGLEWLFNPHFDSIFEFKTWTAAYGQIFFSLSICYGIIIAYSSYLHDRSDIANNATMTAFINCGFSVLSAILIFSVLGYAATQQGVAIKDVAGSGIGLAFISIPMAINMMPAPKVIGTLFFLALFVAGFTSIISIVEVCCSTIIDKYKMNRRVAVSIFCFVGCCFTLVFTAKGGVHILDIVDHFINNFGIVFAGIIEIVFVSWFLKLDAIKEHINRRSDFTVGLLWTFCLKYLIPIFLGYMAIGNLVEELTTSYGNYAKQAIFYYGWAIVIVMILFSFSMQYISLKKQRAKINEVSK
jgi:neurotransmitter:Na+ symporter, NSS family